MSAVDMIIEVIETCAWINADDEKYMLDELAELKRAREELAGRGWVSVNDGLPEYGVKVLIYWRPIDHEERPFHREIMVAQRSVFDENGVASVDSDKWWSGTRYYDTATFITHWMPLPPVPDNER